MEGLRPCFDRLGEMEKYNNLFNHLNFTMLTKAIIWGGMTSKQMPKDS